MITVEEYFGPHKGHKDATDERVENAKRLLLKCAALETEMFDMGVEFPINPTTKSGVSGTTYGGFRPQDCPIGAPNSAHKLGLAVDRYDPLGKIDKWLLEHPEKLRKHGIYIEHPTATSGWSHWSSKAPKSGNYIFYP